MPKLSIVPPRLVDDGPVFVKRATKYRAIEWNGSVKNGVKLLELLPIDSQIRLSLDGTLELFMYDSSVHKHTKVEKFSVFVFDGTFSNLRLCANYEVLSNNDFRDKYEELREHATRESKESE